MTLLLALFLLYSILKNNSILDKNRKLTMELDMCIQDLKQYDNFHKTLFMNNTRVL